MNTLQEAEARDKKVLMRVDFNVAVEGGKAKESFKISACKKSVKYLLERGAKVALLSHLGRPEGKIDPKYSISQVKSDVENILGFKMNFIDDCVGEKVAARINNLEKGEVLLLENVRFYADDESNNPDFALKLAANFDIFVNEAFGVCHRDQASVTGVAKILPGYAGLWLQKEVENLDKIRDNPEHPAVAIIGGAKIETKVPLINNFEKNYDAVLVGSKIAMEAKEQGKIFSDKVMLPLDYAAGGMDIGPETIAEFRKIISSAKTVVWNGPVGKFEEAPYDAGTKGILEAIVAGGAFSVVGGGESVEFLEQKKMLDKISFVSTGGGAMLEYMSGKKLPGIEILNR